MTAKFFAYPPNFYTGKAFIMVEALQLTMASPYNDIQGYRPLRFSGRHLSIIVVWRSLSSNLHIFERIRGRLDAIRVACIHTVARVSPCLEATVQLHDVLEAHLHEPYRGIA